MATTDPDHDPIIFAPELSDRLGGIPLGTIRYWDYAGTGPKSFKLGRRRAWRLSEVENWLAAQESATANVAVRA
ncbi:DNA-binding protein [Mycolicibacterium neoaurum]|uniref:helix-turn-helix transcriptional regulator n=1 Tax=Mycolicibacterium neoaurum TaxID=1795 RepID=UPI00248B69F8|nr:DNA-binding protein [Mycolicibacterium neoaurum]WBP93868.1 DNA-binding protein [Mycolicibacterium neoaurum]WBS07661.1 DNA-binding protein [Mycolicibacterium neoaurum]